MAHGQSLVDTHIKATRRSDVILPSLKDPPPKFVRNFESRSNQFSKLDNKYAHKSCGEFLGSKEHGLRKQANGAILHKSNNIISWDNSVKPESYMSRTQGTYTSPQPGCKPCHALLRRFPRETTPATPQYTLSTTTSCWQPDPSYQTLYKVMAETQHRLKKPNSWRYSTHPDYKLSDLKIKKVKREKHT